MPETELHEEPIPCKARATKSTKYERPKAKTKIILKVFVKETTSFHYDHNKKLTYGRYKHNNEASEHGNTVTDSEKKGDILNKNFRQ